MVLEDEYHRDLLHKEWPLWHTCGDSVDASQYMAGLVEAITLADVVVYVTSREKYASIDEVKRLLTPTW